MVQLAIEFSVTIGSFFDNKELNSSFLIVIIEVSNNLFRTRFRQNTLLKSSINKIDSSIHLNNVSVYMYDPKMHDIKELDLKEDDYFKSFVTFETKAHQKNIISLQDSVLFLHPRKYILIEQELDATNEVLLDTSIILRIQTILENLNLLKK